MRLTKKFIDALSVYELNILAEGLSVLMKKHIDPSEVEKVLKSLSDQYGGWGLVSVMDYVRNNN